MNQQKDFRQMSNDELLLEYKQTKDIQLKQELTLRYVDLVKKIAVQMRDVYLSFTQIDDIINEGVLAIMNGIEKFDPEMNVKFETFISKRIRGLIIDLARKHDWIPRGIRKTAKEIENATSVLYERLGRFPTNQEIANYMNLPLDRYLDELGKTNLSNILSLDSLMEEATDSVNLKRLSGAPEEMLPEDYLLHEECRELLMSGIELLRDNEKKVIALYYQNEVNMKDIARILQVSEPRVSQIHANAIRKLKIFMEKNMKES